MDDRRVVDLGRDPGFATKPLARRLGDVIARVQAFDRDLTIEPRVIGEVYFTHAARAEAA